MTNAWWYLGLIILYSLETASATPTLGEKVTDYQKLASKCERRGHFISSLVNDHAYRPLILITRSLVSPTHETLLHIESLVQTSVVPGCAAAQPI